jgi:hypothetical protein
MSFVNGMDNIRPDSQPLIVKDRTRFVEADTMIFQVVGRLRRIPGEIHRFAPFLPACLNCMRRSLITDNGDCKTKH